jgi:hypothetical protein
MTMIVLLVVTAAFYAIGAVLPGDRNIKVIR